MLSPLTCHTPWVIVQVHRYVSLPFLVSGDLHLILSSATIFCKESACTAGDVGLLPRLGRFAGGGHGDPHQYSCLENPMNRGAWWATVHGVTESDMTEATTEARTIFYFICLLFYILNRGCVSKF